MAVVVAVVPLDPGRRAPAEDPRRGISRLEYPTPAATTATTTITLEIPLQLLGRMNLQFRGAGSKNTGLTLP